MNWSFLSTALAAVWLGVRPSWAASAGEPSHALYHRHRNLRKTSDHSSDINRLLTSGNHLHEGVSSERINNIRHTIRAARQTPLDAIKDIAKKGKDAVKKPLMGRINVIR